MFDVLTELTFSLGFKDGTQVFNGASDFRWPLQSEGAGDARPCVLSPVKLCHCLVSLGVLNDGTKEAFRRRRFEAAA